MKNFTIIGMIFLLFSCGTSSKITKTVKFSPIDNEITTIQSLKDYLSNNPNPKIVLRTRSEVSSENVDENDRNNYLYNAIESELLKSGFIVRDRELFERIIANSDNNNNYENLKEKSDTDLIIELTDLNRSVIYKTNKYYDSKGREGTSGVLAKTLWYGATIEFKVIMINTNEFAGIYKFNYVPCINGCEYGGSKKRMTQREMDEMLSFEAVEEDTLIEFAKVATNELISAMIN